VRLCVEKAITRILMYSYRNHLQSIDDLITTYEAIRAGFVALSLEKNRRATPFVAEARALKEATAQAESPVELRH
jgi:Restriction endonuclease BsobI